MGVPTKSMVGWLASLLHSRTDPVLPEVRPVALIETVVPFTRQVAGSTVTVPLPFVAFPVLDAALQGAVVVVVELVVVVVAPGVGKVKARGALPWSDAAVPNTANTSTFVPWSAYGGTG